MLLYTASSIHSEYLRVTLSIPESQLVSDNEVKPAGYKIACFTFSQTFWKNFTGVINVLDLETCTIQLFCCFLKVSSKERLVVLCGALWVIWLILHWCCVVHCGLRFTGKLRLTSVTNEQNQKHIRVERAATPEQQQQHQQLQLRAKCVWIYYVYESTTC